MHPRDAAAGAIALGVGATTMALWYVLRRKYARKPAAPGTEHRCRVIRGDNVARRVWRDLTDDLRILREEKNVVPKLVFVTSSDTGHRHVSAAMRLLHDEVPGLRVTEHALPWGCGTTALVAAIAELNADRDVHAVSVQLPLGDDVDVSRVLGALAPEKDAEGLSDANFKEMCLKQGKPLAVPTTAIGALEVLWRFNVPLQGRRAVVIGRSNTVGLPVAQLLLHNNATVTICHSFTADMKAVVQEADILVATNGKPNTVRGARGARARGARGASCGPRRRRPRRPPDRAARPARRRPAAGR